MAHARLSDRQVISLSGPDRVDFLQGLVSNDVTQCKEGKAIWAALLTSKGRYRADFFISSEGEALWLDIDAMRAEATYTQLKRYILRSKLDIALTDRTVFAGWDVAPPPGAHADPRLAQAGWRKICLRDEEAPQCAFEVTAYEAHCLEIGLPPSCVYQVDETLLLEANFDLLNGISWTKGCYVGQEVTARMHYRGGVRKRLVPVSCSEGNLPEPGTILMAENGEEAGEMRLTCGQSGFALLRKPFWRSSIRHSGLMIVSRPPKWLT